MNAIMMTYAVTKESLSYPISLNHIQSIGLLGWDSRSSLSIYGNGVSCNISSTNGYYHSMYCDDQFCVYNVNQ